MTSIRDSFTSSNNYMNKQYESINDANEIVIVNETT